MLLRAEGHKFNRAQGSMKRGSRDLACPRRVRGLTVVVIDWELCTQSPCGEAVAALGHHALRCAGDSYLLACFHGYVGRTAHE